MITPRRTRLIRTPDLHAFRHAIATLVTAAAGRGPTLVIVPTAGAARQLTRTIAAPADVAIVTREGWYDWLHARLPGAARRLNGFERDSLIQAAAREAADAEAPSHAEAEQLPFRLRPGLIAEMLRFYDQLRRQSQRLERFGELIEETLGGGDDDRGTARLLAQTRFLMAAFRAYERRAAASGAWDEHTLRDQLMQRPTTPPARHAIVTVADWIAEPDGLYVGDFDLLARLPGLQHLDLICTEPVLGSGFHERVHSWWPGLDEVDAVALCGPCESPRPVLEIPGDGSDDPWFTRRDREDELAAVAQHVKAARRAATVPAPLDRTAVVYKRPLPYLYLAASTLGAAGIAYESADELPLAGEPFVATLDLILEAVQSAFAREALLALLNTPHLVAASPGLPAGAVQALDTELRNRIYIGDLERLEECATSWHDDLSRPALEAALAIAHELAPLRNPDAASTQIRRLVTFMESRLQPLDDDDPLSVRESDARASVFGILRSLAEAHAAHHDPDWGIEALASSIRRWVEEQTFRAAGAVRGVQLIDDRAARYADLDDITIVGLVESEWPERQARNIFYTSGVLKSLGWPSEHTRRRASDGRFIDLLRSPRLRVAVSTVMLDDEAIVMRSMQLDETPRARLATLPTTERWARITRGDALVRDPVDVASLPPAAREWAELRLTRTAAADPRYHGQLSVRRPERPWSVSALETYLACPFKFYAQHVLRLEEEPEDSDVMNPRQQGEFVHKVFETFFAEWQAAGHGAITPANLDQARAVFGAVVETQLRVLPEAEAGLERTRLLGSSAAAGLGEAVMRMEAERPIRVLERKLEARVDGAVTIATAGGPRTIPLRGKADRIDLLEDGSFRVIDYKLGWPPQRARALQLPIYALAAQQRMERETGRHWELGEAVYLAFKGPKRVVPLFGRQSDRDQVLADAQQRVADTLDAIGRGEFPPQPEDVFLCEQCRFAAVCRKDYVDETAV